VFFCHFYLITQAITSATPLSSGLGIISSTLGFLIYSAKAIAASNLCSSVIFTTLFSKAPLNIPGNTSTLFNWLGKSERHVATILAQAFLAKSGIISGVGFAIAKIIGSGFIDFTISSVSTHGAETQIKTSLFFTACSNHHLIQDFDSISYIQA